MIVKMKKIVLLLVIVVVITLVYYLNIKIAITNPPKGYFIANHGSDSNDGLSVSTPWRTIGKVNNEMKSGGVIEDGDDVLFRRGDTFSDTYLEMNDCGTSSEQMVIGAYGDGNRPIFNSGGTFGIHWNVVSGQNVRFENIEVTGSSQGMSFRKDNTRNIELYNMVVRDVSANGFLFYTIDGLLVENCVAYNCNLGGIILQGSSTYRITNTIIRNCTVYNIGTDGFSVHPTGGNPGGASGPNHAFINCVAYNCGENAFDITTGENILIKDCEGYNNGEASILLDHGPRYVTIDNYYSHDENVNNIVFHVCYDTILRNSVLQDYTNADLYIYGTLSSEGDMVGLTVYNNDFITSYDESYIEIFDESEDIIFQNNIFYSTLSNRPNTAIWYVTTGLTASNSNWNNNMYWRGDGTSGNWWFYGGSSHNLNQWNRNAEVYNDVVDNPEFTGVGSSDFTLQSTSPCIDAGGWLTTTNGGGTGTTITVHEASYFFPGISTLGVAGDNIFIGNDTNLEVIAVDGNTETIIVNRNITWVDGEVVSLSSYIGSAPDIGALEFVFISPEKGNVGHFQFFCLALFCFVIMTRKVYKIKTRKISNNGINNAEVNNKVMCLRDGINNG